MICRMIPVIFNAACIRQSIHIQKLIWLIVVRRNGNMLTTGWVAAAPAQALAATVMNPELGMISIYLPRYLLSSTCACTLGCRLPIRQPDIHL